jgi:hypothetical protein
MGRPLVLQNSFFCLFSLLISVAILSGQAPTIAITSPQSGTITLDAASITAGENLTVHVELDRATDLPNGYLSVDISGPGSVSSGNSVETKADKRAYDVEVLIPPDAPGGTWYINAVYVGSHSGMHRTQVKVERQAFEVVQKTTFTLPTEAKVTISLSQTQLLRREAAKLQSKVEALRASLDALSGSKKATGAQRILRQNVLDAEESLKTTEEEFLGLITAPSQRPAASVFFGDLHITYQTVLGELNSSAYQKSLALPVNFQSSSKKTEPAVLAQAVFRAFELNETAYNLVADTGLLTFDLDVRTNPEGASVSYGRRGDKDTDFTRLQDPTNSVIKALAYATWKVRFEKAGYLTETREHNSLTDKNHVVTVELVAVPVKK